MTDWLCSFGFYFPDLVGIGVSVLITVKTSGQQEIWEPLLTLVERINAGLFDALGPGCPQLRVSYPASRLGSPQVSVLPFTTAPQFRQRRGEPYHRYYIIGQELPFMLGFASASQSNHLTPVGVPVPPITLPERSGTPFWSGDEVFSRFSPACRL